LYKNLAEFECQGQRSKVKVTGDKNVKMLNHPHRQCMVRRRVRCRPYAARSSRRLHCVAAGGDAMTAVHVDGGLRASRARLRRWENQRTLSGYILKILGNSHLSLLTPSSIVLNNPSFKFSYHLISEAISSCCEHLRKLH